MKKIQIILFNVLSILSPLTLFSQAADGILFVAHRGASYLAPENTLASIRLAWELGADAAECDVMLTSDKEVILCHDKNTKNLTGKSFEVSETSWEQLSQLRVNPRKTNLPEYTNETIPRLKDVKKHLPLALEKGLDGMNLHYRLIRASLTKKCASAGLDLWCWTVNDPETAQQMKERGVSAITTDRPAWLKEHMARTRMN
jgi:glycerophosphoryl diester phosphodiesterase